MPQILILNDNEMVLQSMARLLSGVGHEVQTAATSRAALSILQRQRIDLLIQDIVRPNEDGWTFARFLKSHTVLRRVPILIATGDRSTPRSDQLALIDELIFLPFDCDELQATIGRILDRYLHHDNAT